MRGWILFFLAVCMLCSKGLSEVHHHRGKETHTEVTADRKLHWRRTASVCLLDVIWYLKINFCKYLFARTGHHSCMDSQFHWTCWYLIWESLYLLFVQLLRFTRQLNKQWVNTSLRPCSFTMCSRITINSMKRTCLFYCQRSGHFMI